MQKQIKHMMCAVACGCFVVTQAGAIPLNYVVDAGQSSVSANTTDPGLVLSTSLALNPASPFVLDNGQSYTFNFFRIWTSEGTVNSGEDTVAKTITARLDFSVPDTYAEVSGQTFGATFLGIYQSGVLTWNGPDTVTVADREFQVSLSDEVFNEGWFGLDEGRRNGAVVQATVTQVSSVSASVPDGGSTLVLAGLSLMGLGFIRRKTA